MKTVAVIPAFNEEKTIGNIVRETKSFADEVLVVNDGSSDKTSEVAKNFGARVINTEINRGLGSALRLGISAALVSGADIIITLDADGQHSPKDIERLSAPVLENRADVVIGSRLKDGTSMPLLRKTANTIGNLLTYVLFGILVSDSQSGFRAFSKNAAEAIDLQTSRMEISSEIISEIKNKNLRLVEIPIKPVYTAYSMSKGQNFFVGVETAFKLFLRRLNK